MAPTLANTRSTTGDGQLLSPEDVARRCGLSRRAVYDAIRRGELPAMRLCNRLRISPNGFDAWLAAGTLAPPTRQSLCVSTSPLPSATGSFRSLLDDVGDKGEG